VSVFIGLPVFVISAYNVYRQELRPSAPPLISILPDWHWSIWVNILLGICLLIVILEFYRRSSSSSGVQSHTETGAQSITTGGSNYGNVIGHQKIVLPDETKILRIALGLTPEQSVNREVLPVSGTKHF